MFYKLSFAGHHGVWVLTTTVGLTNRLSLLLRCLERCFEWIGLQEIALIQRIASSLFWMTFGLFTNLKKNSIQNFPSSSACCTQIAAIANLFFFILHHHHHHCCCCCCWKPCLSPVCFEIVRRTFHSFVHSSVAINCVVIVVLLSPRWKMWVRFSFLVLPTFSTCFSSNRSRGFCCNCVCEFLGPGFYTKIKKVISNPIVRKQGGAGGDVHFCVFTTLSVELNSYEMVDFRF